MNERDVLIGQLTHQKNEDERIVKEKNLEINRLEAG